MDVLSPAQLPAFAGQNVLTRCRKIASGGTNNLFIDNQGMILLCGKWKTSGDGSSGQVRNFSLENEEDFMLENAESSD